MNQKNMGSVFAALLLAAAVYSCSVKEIQSPIVFRSPVVLQKAEVKEPLESSEPAQPPAETEDTTESAVSEPRPVRVPADIVLLSDKDLADSRLSTLASIYISIPADEFTQDRAVQELKVEAFERFGPLAYGIANIEHEKKVSVIPGRQDHQEVSADVITLTQEGAASQRTAAASPDRGSSTVEDSIAPEEGLEGLSLESIRILTPDDLYHLSFRIVGRVSVRDRSQKGYTREEAIRALKTEAARNHGMQAMGLSNVKLVRSGITYYYEKTRRTLNLTERGDTYMKASADVVFWDRES